MAARPITITVINQLPGVGVTFTDPSATHGTTPKVTSGPNPIPDDGGQASVFAENTGLYGPQGAFAYQFTDGSSSVYQFKYVHPMGDGQTSVTVTPPSGFIAQMTVDNLAHHNASCTIELLQQAS